MTMELVTGHAGEPHVTAAQDAALHAGVIGGDDYVLSTKDRFAINVVSANKVTIAGGDLVMQGYHASNDKPADLIITNGSQGQKRNDIICCRYTKVGDSIESANLVVVKGTPTTGTPVDPTLNTTPISQGATTYDMALYRVPLDGITIGEPEPMFNILQPMSSVWDSLTHTDVTTLISGNYGTVKGYRSGPMVTLRIDWKTSASGSWNSGTFGTLPESWRPPMDLNFSYGGRDGANQKSINVNANGTMTYTNQGGTQGTNAFGMTVSYAL
ncbi:hypothetical protein [Bifidobacterium longum]|uniref:hypothetical protein n=2 Tax=Bifidobacterium longum TaxID=216816 RepID=UPI0020CAC863|nr:hypothetical protein [Bifidobacterium longum]